MGRDSSLCRAFDFDLGGRPPAGSRVTTAGAAAGGGPGVLPGVGRQLEGVEGAELHPDAVEHGDGPVAGVPGAAGSHADEAHIDP